MSSVQVYLARHGQTDDNVSPLRFQGQSDTPLNEVGARQAQELAERATNLGLRSIFTSHLSRARRTAEIVGGRVGLEPVVDERLAEGFRGAWEGRLMTEVERDDPQAYAAWLRADPEFRFPAGESLAEHRERALRVLAEVACEEEPALVITHGGTIRFVLLELRGLEISHFHEVEVGNGELIPLGRDAVEQLVRTARAPSG